MCTYCQQPTPIANRVWIPIALLIGLAMVMGPQIADVVAVAEAHTSDN